MVHAARSLFPYVFDSSSLIFLEKEGHMGQLRRRRDQVILPEKVREEVSQQGSPLGRFLKRYPHVVTPLTLGEEDRYLEIRGQPGIHDGEAAAITLALSRAHPLVIEDKRGRTKAENHGVQCLSGQDFIARH